MSTDPRDYIDVESQPCQIGRAAEPEDRDVELADGKCEECGKFVCRFPSCSVELPNGLLLCVDCDEDIKAAASKEQKQEKAA